MSAQRKFFQNTCDINKSKFSWRHWFQEGRVEFTAADFFAQPEYSSTTIKNDIGLIRLPTPVNFSGTLKMLLELIEVLGLGVIDATELIIAVIVVHFFMLKYYLYFDSLKKIYGWYLLVSSSLYFYSLKSNINKRNISVRFQKWHKMEDA